MNSFKRLRTVSRTLLSAILAVYMSTGYAQAPNPDPWENINRPVFHFNKALDTVLIKPVAVVYSKYLPAPARSGVRNFFNNLDDVNVVLNDVLQLKMHNALNDSGRLLINTTVGVVGLIDVASNMGMYKNYEDFGQTLGYWGVGDGGYLMLPVFGSSTVRDTVGMIPDMIVSPLGWLSDPRTRAGFYALDMVDTRVSYMPAEAMIRGDEYVFVRNAYMQRREYLVADGHVQDDFDDY